MVFDATIVPADLRTRSEGLLSESVATIQHSRHLQALCDLASYRVRVVCGVLDGLLPKSAENGGD